MAIKIWLFIFNFTMITMFCDILILVIGAIASGPVQFHVIISKSISALFELRFHESRNAKFNY